MLKVSWLISKFDRAGVQFSDQPIRLTNVPQTHSADSLLHLSVHLFVPSVSGFLLVSRYLIQHSFNTVAFLLPPFPFDLHSRKRSLYFDFYIRYLIQLLFCFALLIFSPPFGLNSLLCLNISLFTLKTHCNFTLHSVLTCVFDAV